MKKIPFLLIPFIFLTGCMYQNTGLTEKQYNQYAGIYLLLEKCYDNEYIDTDNTALGRIYLNSTLSRYTYDNSILDAKYNEFKKMFENNPISQNELRYTCKNIELNLVQVKKQKEMNSMRSDNHNIMINNNITPKVTYCNKVGFQTICNSY